MTEPTHRREVSRFAVWALVGFLSAFVVWTWLVAGTKVMWDFDHAMRPPGLGDMSFEILRAIAVFTMPLVLVLISLAMSWWAYRRRLRNLSYALLAAPLLAWAVSFVVNLMVHRARPPARYDPTFTESGWSYPSGHVTVAMAFAVMAVTMLTVLRRPRRTLRTARIVAVVGITVVVLDRWLLAAHWASDIVGALLLGGASAAAAAVASGLVRQPAWFSLPAPAQPEGERPVCAVIYNPVKVGDELVFQRRVQQELAERGWDDPLWYATTPADPGYAMSRRAIAARVDLVIVAGGDGTVRVVTSELAHSDIPIAIVPAGTANLLARNLGIPLDEDDALLAAFEGRSQPIDLVLVTIDGNRRDAEHFCVMGGLGIDGKVMADTNVQLKKAVKSVAYFVAVAQNLNLRPVPATITVDGKLVSDNPATLMLVGNVGEIQAGLKMFPHATPHDGELDLIATGPSGFGQWFRWGVGVLRRRHGAHVLQQQGRHVEIAIADPMPYQLDGDTLGMARTFEAEVIPAAVHIRMPQR